MKLISKDILLKGSLRVAFLAVVMVAMVLPQRARAAEFANEDLNYEIVYH